MFVVLSIVLFATIAAHIPFYATTNWLGIIIAEMIGGMALNLGIVPWNSYLPELARDETSLEVGLGPGWVVLSCLVLSFRDGRSPFSISSSQGSSEVGSDPWKARMQEMSGKSIVGCRGGNRSFLCPSSSNVGLPPLPPCLSLSPPPLLSLSLSLLPPSPPLPSISPPPRASTTS